MAMPMSAKANRTTACRALGHRKNHQYTAQPIEFSSIQATTA